MPAYFAAVAELLPPTLVLDDAHRVVEAFGGAERLLRLKTGPVDTNVFALLDTVHRETLREAFARVEAGEQPVVIDAFARASDGTELAATLRRAEGADAFFLFTLGDPAGGPPPADIHLNPVSEDANRQLRSVNEQLHAVNQEHRNTISELRATSQDLKRLLSSTHIATLFLSRDLRIRRFTPAIRTIIALEPTDIGRRLTSFQHRLKWPSFYRDLEEAAHEGRSLLREVDDNAGRRLLVKARPVVDEVPESGSPSAEGGLPNADLTVTMSDVTATYRAAATARDRERRLERLTNALPVMVGFVDVEGRYRFVNDRYLDFYGKRREEIIGSTIADLTGPDVYRHLRKHVKAALAGEQVAFEVDFPSSNAPGRFLVDYVPIHDDGRSVQGFYITSVDITERHQTELALQRARDVEAKASEAKSQFLANV
ncbi:MAG: PAS domain-containing protein, partial [Myxococcota bacterium]